MKYMGSKNRIAKELLPIILKDRKEGQWYVEPFVGGANMIDKVGGKRIGYDSNEYLISMWQALQQDFSFPKNVTKAEYEHIKKNKDKYDKHLVGYVGFNYSYSGKFFGGYAGLTKTKIGTIRDYQSEANNNIANQIKNLKGSMFVCSSFEFIFLPENSIIYCDPPYEGTTKYKDEFSHVVFWDKVREWVKEGHKVFVSEYNAPKDFVCVWQKQVKSSLSANGDIGGSKTSTEKLFIHKSQANA